MREIKLVPFVCSAGGQVMGSERGALDLKETGLAERLAASGVSVSWQTDPAALYDSPFGKAAHQALAPLGTEERKQVVLWHCRHIQEDVKNVLVDGNLPVTIGGDHAMALGSISGIAAAKDACGHTGVIWVDAHADINTPDTSLTQALHGMPVAALAGLGDADFVAAGGVQPAIRLEDIVYIGLRDVDPGEKKRIAECGITAFWMSDIAALGLEEVFAKARAILDRKETKAKILSIDLDGFDPKDVPATGSPAPDGLKPEEMLPVLRDLCRDTVFDLIEIAEYNPMLPGREKTAAFIERLLIAVLRRD